MNRKRWMMLPSILALTTLLLGACGGSPAGGTSVWIDVPVDGLGFPAVQEIKVAGHAASAAGINRVEVWVNGALFTTVHNPPMEGTLASFHTGWMPTEAGEYTIQVVAFGMDGAASPADAARVTFGVAGAPTVAGGCPTPIGGGPTPVSCGPTIVSCPSPVGGGPTPVSCVTEIITDTPVPVTETPTPTIPPALGAAVQFWADPEKIEAGACTTIHWHAENVQKIIFGGIEQPLDGSYKDCLCGDQRYTLKVMKQDGTEEKHRVEIKVKGECATEAPAQPPATGDITPPAVPSLRVPADGLSIACKASQTLAWLPVDDASGIAKYGVQAQRHAGDNNWQAAPGGDQTVTGKSTTIPVECGWYYRWRVIAVDGAGNESGWSGWFTFAVPLT